MMSISHWGQFEPRQAISVMPPLSWIAEIFRLQKVLEEIVASTKGHVISGTYLRMTA